MLGAALARESERCSKAYHKILCTKSSEGLTSEGEELLHWKETQTLFHRIGLLEGIDFQAEIEPNRKRPRRSLLEFKIPVRITYHTPSRMWNLSQLTNAIPPNESLETVNPQHCVEVRGDPELEGLYVDFNTFQHACELLGVSVPASALDSDADPRAEQFLSVDMREGDLVIAEEKLLLGIAMFKRSSRTMYYGDMTYSEVTALQLCTEHDLGNMHRGIIQSSYPPQNIKALCRRRRTQESCETERYSLTESDDPDSIRPFVLHRHPSSNTDHTCNTKFTEEWVDQQTKRRRRAPISANMKSQKVVGGYLVPANDEYLEYAKSSLHSSTVLTGQVFQ